MMQQQNQHQFIHKTNVANSKNNNTLTWSGFYKKTLQERQNQVKLVFAHVFKNKSNSTNTTDINNIIVPDTAEETSLLTPSASSSVYATPNTSPCGSFVNLNLTINNDDNNQGNIDDLVDKLDSLNINDKHFPINGLDENIADKMVENCIGTIGLPVGLALNFVINDKQIIIPMAIEEPSVIAGVSGAAKTISSYKGFTAIAPERNMIIAQVALLDIPEDSINLATKKLMNNKIEIINFANKFCESMVRRGGGVLDIDFRRIPRKNKRPIIDINNENYHHHLSISPSNFKEWLIVHLKIDVCDAMGANCASTVAEGVAPLLSEITGGRIGLRIVSNLNVERLVKASFSIPVPMLAYKSLSGEEVANRIIEAYEFAEVDKYRATTHNKGIMNGIDAVAIATGQDWRAIEAAAHVWACDHSRNSNKNLYDDNYYRPLTHYWIKKNDDNDNNKQRQLMFCGELEIPIAVGTAGGVLKTNPVYSYNLGIMGNPDTRELSMIMACVGLAQNFAALRALSTEGIQRGHMSLHAKNLAIAAGCPTDATFSITQHMIEQGRISLSAAKEFLELYDKMGKKPLNIHLQCVPM